MQSKKITIELDLSEKGQIFTHEDTNTGKVTTFLIDLMQKVASEYGGKCSEIRARKVPITKEVVAITRKNFGIEQDRLNRLKSPYLFMPILAVQWDAGSNALLSVDGNHRMIKLFELGYTTINCYVFNYPFWENFTADVVLPENFMQRNSGILEWEKQKNAI